MKPSVQSRRSTLTTARALFALAAFSAAHAQTLSEKAESTLSPGILSLDPINVIGSKENAALIPGSATFVVASDFTNFQYDDINQVVRRIPGVYIRQEDGYGLFPNVSLRGVSTTRNSKLTIMEDGILMAPAPYSDPAAYYTPNAGRMSGLEVLKGSSQIKYGPETTGGVINYLSTPIPENRAGFLSAAYGSDNDLRLHASFGDRIATAWGSFGYVVENVYRTTDGFKSIDAAPGGGYAGSDETGFERNEPLVKLLFAFNTAVPQSLNLSYGRTDIDADETYLGLTETDFRANPFRRYAASRFDTITTEQERASARYQIRPTDTLEFSLTAYRTEFARNWYKLDGVGEGTAGAFRNLSEALAGQFGSGIVNVLKGEAAGRLRVRANNRAYGAQGAELASALTFDTGSVAHRLETGLRVHKDFADRFQWDDVYTQTATGSAALTTAGTPGTQENRRAESKALAFYVQDEMTLGRLMLTPGVRFESIDYTDIRRSTAPATLSQITNQRENSLDYVAPGLGATWKHSEKITFLAGIHRGISPPGPGSVGTALEEESSVGIEAGVRFNNRRDLSLELIAFHTAFSDLIVENNAGGGGGAGQTSNIGEVDSSGLEFALAFDPSVSRGWTFRNPWNLSLTWTRARLGNDVDSAGNGGSIAESIFSGGRKGNELPYIPEYQIALGTGIEHGKWGAYVDSYYQPRTWASASNSAATINPDASAAAGLQPALDSRYGRIDAFFLLDVAVHYRFTPSVVLKLSATNVLDWEYLASRVPIGPRPGAPRTLLAGLDLRF